MTELNKNANRVALKAQERFARQTHRGDISIANYAPLGEDAVRVCAVYSGGQPTQEDFRDWTRVIGQGRLMFHPETLVDHGQFPKACISFALSYQPEKMPLAQAEANPNFVAITANKYLDSEFSVNWTKKEISGKTFVVRDEPHALIQSVEAHTESAGSKMAKRTHGYLNVQADVPQKIMYIREDCTVGIGFILPSAEANAETQLTVSDVGLEKTITIAKNGIILVMAMDASEKKKVKDYFTKIWNADMATKIMQGH